MIHHLFHNLIFSGAIFRFSAALIFMLYVLIPFHTCLAAEDAAGNYSVTNMPGQQSAVVLDDQHHRTSLLLGYVRTNAPGWVPGLPPSLRDPGGWLKRRLGFGGTSSDGDNEPSEPSLFQPIAALMQPPIAEGGEALWLSPNYHHKGFMPFDDAVVMGFNMRHSAYSNRVQLDVHPFYGQNWHSTDGYYGTEVSIGLGHKSGIGSLINWGKIALRYTNGDASMMDHGHGFDMHSEMNFDEHLSLNAGVRQSDNTNMGNYVLLRWKLVGDN